MKEVESYNVSVFIGLRERYSDHFHSKGELMNLIQDHVDEYPICVNVTECTFVYKDGRELGARIEFINYPRFPITKDEILDRAIILAKILKEKFHQYRVSIVTPEKTYMIE